ncbi:MAG: hypothetical protein RL769_594, partial [Pseudomonadota bacterium]
MPKFISVIRDNEIIIKFLKDFKSQTIVNLAICSTLVKENLRFQTIRSTDHVGCPGIVFKDPIFIAGYVLDASIKSDLVRSKTFYQFHVEFEKKSKDARRLKDDYRFGYSGLSMCSTFQSFDEKLESYFLRDPQDFSSEFFYNRKPDNLIYYSSEQYFDKDHQEIKIPALRPVYLPDTKEVVHNEVHILAGLNHVENVFINSEDLMRGFLFRKAFSSRDIE